MSWSKSTADNGAIIDAKIAIRRAAREIADCARCAEGWHDTGKGVVKCECRERWELAAKQLLNLDSKAFMEDSFFDFKRRETGPFVAAGQVRELRQSMERMANKGAE